MEVKIAVIGSGYWGRNLVRNFAELGALHTIWGILGTGNSGREFWGHNTKLLTIGVSHNLMHPWHA